jgi:hypothetical protein
MPNELEYPLVDVAVTLIVRGGRILAVYNRPWSAFTVPMTKRRCWQDPSIPPAAREEDWVEAAARAAAEWLGCTSTTPPQFLADIAEWRQGDRDGVWKRYHFQVFKVELKEGDETSAGAICEWLSPDQFLDENRRPISPTARHLIKELQDQAQLQGRSFA